MTQYVVIVLLVALFRGVVWVVQRLQERAKARAEAARRTGPVDATRAEPDPAAQPMERRQAEPAIDVRAQPVREASSTPVPPKAARVPGRSGAHRSGATRTGTTQRVATRSGAAASQRRGASGASSASSASRRGALRPNGSLAPTEVPNARTAHMPASSSPGVALPSPPAVRPQRASEVASGETRTRMRSVLSGLRSTQGLRQAVLAAEVLGPPKGLS